MFENRLPDLLQTELEVAARMGVRRVRVGGPGFPEVVAAGEVKWAVVGQERQLFVVPKFVRGQEIAPTVLTGGAPVLAAGEAELAFMNGRY